MIKAARVVLLMAFVVLLFNSGARFLMGLTLAPMADDLDWSRTTLSVAVTVFMIISASSLPFIGGFVDRFGAHRVLTFGVIVSGVSVALMSVIATPVQMLLLYGILFALGSAATSVTPIGVLVTAWFPARAGIANSVAIAGMGTGQLLIISVLASQFGLLGWRGSYAAVGLATLVCVLPLLVLVKRLSVNASADVDKATDEAARNEAQAELTKFATLRDALSAWRFHRVLLVYLICGFQDFFIATHIVAFALDEGLAGPLAGNMLAFMGLAGLIGVLLAGGLNDRYGPATPTVLNFVLRVVLFALVLVFQSPAAIIVAALLYGLTFWMTAPLAVVFARLFCALPLLGASSGLITMVHHFAGGAGALFGARVFDLSGSYGGAMWSMLVLSVVGLAFSPWLGRIRSRKLTV